MISANHSSQSLETNWNWSQLLLGLWLQDTGVGDGNMMDGREAELRINKLLTPRCCFWLGKISNFFTTRDSFSHLLRCGSHNVLEVNVLCPEISCVKWSRWGFSLVRICIRGLWLADVTSHMRHRIKITTSRWPKLVSPHATRDVINVWMWFVFWPWCNHSWILQIRMIRSYLNSFNC